MAKDAKGTKKQSVRRSVDAPGECCECEKKGDGLIVRCARLLCAAVSVVCLVSVRGLHFDFFFCDILSSDAAGASDGRSFYLRLAAGGGFTGL